ncbi:MAG: SPFH domain-containing protein [Planctomycetota bacterium]|nr:SPFH domain-containing protein [Planctomycetota bacterium]
MGLFSKLRAEFVDIIEWIDDTRRTLVWRFPRYHNQIKNGAQLIVRPGQVAVFVHEGQLADVFEPGMHTLETNNVPILSTLQGWKHGFDSPFKCEIYFVNTRVVTDLKWGTPSPVMMRDPEFGPIRLRAFGTYTMRALDPRALITELVGTDGVFETDELETLMRGVIGSTLADVLGSSKIAALDLASNYTEIGEELRKAVCENIDDEYGLEVPQLFVVNVSFPEEVEKALDKRTSMGVIGDIGRYQQFQMAEAMTEAAANPGGGAGDGMGLGMGFAMANQMVRGYGQGGAGGTIATPPPLPTQMQWYYAADGQSMGPISQTQMETAVKAGQVESGTMVWHAGMGGWQAAGEVPQLAAVFGPPPPPPPPPA